MVIKKAYIIVPGDTSVGIPNSHFELEMYFDTDWLAEKYRSETLAIIKSQIVELYELMGEENVKVMFDFEVEAEIEREKELE